MKQITNTILMIRPHAFRKNEQTAVNNYYQSESGLSGKDLTKKALDEFDAYVACLRAVGIQVLVVDDDPKQDTPDALFPNNWISFHESGKVGVYPMFAENRRLERRLEIIETIEEQGFFVSDIIDYTSAETEGYFLEGTGSIVLDRSNEKAYCALSPRADEGLFIEFCEDFEYTPVIFKAYQSVENKRLLIYHTNVMMCIAETFAVVCLESIDDKKERKNVVRHLQKDGKEVIAITEAQVNCFAGNMLQVKGKDDVSYLVMSNAAYNSLEVDQKNIIKKHCAILHSDLSVIEKHGGGSARCMMAEVFLPPAVC